MDKNLVDEIVDEWAATYGVPLNYWASTGGNIRIITSDWRYFSEITESGLIEMLRPYGYEVSFEGDDLIIEYLGY